jgi:iron complex transport system substrate-binding protein
LGATRQDTIKAGLFFMRYISVCLLFVIVAAGTALAGQRYISLAPSTTEILFALGLDDEIAGVSAYCNYPPAASIKPKIGDFSHPNMEKICSLKPDYIFCTGLEQAPVITELKRLKLHVYVADPANMSELFATIRDIGKLTHREEEARSVINAMTADIEMIRAKTQTIPQQKKMRVFLEIWHEPLMTAGKGSFVDELISLAGGINIAHDVIRPYCNYSAEKVIGLNPDCIIMTYMDSEQAMELVERRFGWSSIAAVKNKRVFNDIDPDLLLRPGPRVTEGLKAVYRKLYQTQ